MDVENGTEKSAPRLFGDREKAGLEYNVRAVEIFKQAPIFLKEDRFQYGIEYERDTSDLDTGDHRRSVGFGTGRDFRQFRFEAELKLKLVGSNLKLAAPDTRVSDSYWTLGDLMRMILDTM